jgi:hypothetical protein
VASIRKYKTANAESRFEVRWRDARGHDRCKTFKLSADAKRFRVDVERRQQLGPLYDAKAEFFGDFLEGWLARYEQRVRRSTYERGVQALRHFQALTGSTSSRSRYAMSMRWSLLWRRQRRVRRRSGSHWPSRFFGARENEGRRSTTRSFGCRRPVSMSVSRAT